MRVRYRVGVFTLVLGMLSGCSWFSSNEHPIPELSWPKDLQILKPRWSDRVSENLVPLVPGVANDAVYVARTDGEVRAFALQTGKLLWKVDLKTPLSGGVGAAEGVIAVGTRSGEIVLLDDEGKERWRKATGGNEISAQPLIANGLVVARSSNGRLVGLTLKDGAKRWTLERNLPALTLYRASGAAASRGAVFAGMPGGKVVALAIESGVVGWESAISTPKGPTELDRVADVTGSPLLGERDLCAGSYQGRVTCLDAASGAQIWSREASAAAGVGGDTSRIYVADEKGVVSAFDRSGGNLAWKNDQFLGRRLIGSTAASGYVAVGDFQGYVEWLDRTDGKLVARGETDGSMPAIAPIFIGSGLLVQTRKGGIYVFPNP